MTNAKELKAQCIRNNMNFEELAKRIGINPTTMYRKIRGESEFQQSEIQAIVKELGLNDSEMMAIFFNL